MAYSNEGQNRRNNRNRQNYRKPPADIENNPILKTFQEYANMLNEKHDRYERLVKQSRDITIESKRIIFLLHTIDSNKNNKDKVLVEAKERLNKLSQTNFANIALELKGLDSYQYTRAYTAGLQEFIEALTFLEFLSDTPLSGWEHVSSEFLTRKGENEEDVSCLLPPMDYMLGILDMSGEVMRKCVNALGSGDVDSCFQSCDVLRSLYTEFMAVGPPNFNREWSRKTYTLKQSLMKSENVCYNVKVRGKEAAKWAAQKNAVENRDQQLSEDEGVY